MSGWFNWMVVVLWFFIQPSEWLTQLTFVFPRTKRAWLWDCYKDFFFLTEFSFFVIFGIVQFMIFLFFQDELFASCRFSPLNNEDYVLYIAAITGQFSLFGCHHLFFTFKNSLIQLSIWNHHEHYVSIDRGASIVTWNTTTWKRIRTKQVVREPVSSFNVSADGKLLAV